MALSEKIANDFKDAFKAGEYERKETLSMLKAAIQNKEIEKGKKEEGLSDEEVTEVLVSEAKKRKDAAGEYEKAGRVEQAEKEKAELAIIEDYLPKQLSREEVSAELQAVISEVGSSGPQDMGKLMGAAMQKLKGRVDGTVVKEELQKLIQ